MDRAGRELDLNLCSPRWEQQSILSPGPSLAEIEPNISEGYGSCQGCVFNLPQYTIIL